MDDLYYMQKALLLARKGTGRVSPNPRVGAVLVKDNRIIGKGYHAYFGGPHAEINALSRLSTEKKAGSTLYVNLEPCTYYGKTPPCTDAIIQAGIRRVVVGITDPNPLVSGRGLAQLRKAGIEVSTGILEEASRQINEAFCKYITQKKPFVTMKIAQTLDGKIATSDGLSKWISGETSRKFVHRLRREHDAVLVGINTIMNDDPELTVRSVPGLGGIRMVLDSHLRILLDAKILKNQETQKTIIVSTKEADPDKINILRKMGVSVWILNPNKEHRVDMKALLKRLAKSGIASMLIEGGKEVFTSILNVREIDRLIIFLAPKLFGSGIDAIGDLGIRSPSDAFSFKEIHWRRYGSDMMFDGRF